MLRDPDVVVCDVVGCDKPASGTYLNGVSRPGYQFFICAEHHDRLKAGAQPVIVAERFDLAQMEVGPALVLE